MNVLAGQPSMWQLFRMELPIGPPGSGVGSGRCTPALNGSPKAACLHDGSNSNDTSRRPSNP